VEHSTVHRTGHGNVQGDEADQGAGAICALNANDVLLPYVGKLVHLIN